MESVTASLVALALVLQFFGLSRPTAVLFFFSLVLVAALLRFHATSSLNLSF
jgi:hypothetical protein